MTQDIYNNTAVSFGAAASILVMDAISQIIVWITAMTAVIICDLVAGIARCVKTGERVRFSKTCRDSVAKFLTYYSVVVAACITQVAGGFELPISMYCCMTVIFIEACSILSNILKWHGYSLDFIKFFSFFAAKKIGVAKEEVEEMIKKDGE